jgi:micrococcal nuclease
MARRPPPLPRAQKRGCSQTFVTLLAGIFIGMFIMAGMKGGGSDGEGDHSAAAESTPVRAAPAPVPVPPVAPLVSQPEPPRAVVVEEQAPARKFDLEGKVVGITDGDTATILTAEKKQVKIRLEGIDAPEDGQEYGQQSKQALSALIFGKMVGIRTNGQDRYGRTLGWIHIDGTDVNRHLVGDGWAWHYTKYNTEADIAKLQEEAKEAKRGLWKAPNQPMAPWEYRSLKLNPMVPDPVAPSPPSEPASTPTAPRGRSFPQPPAEAKANPASRDYWINSNGVRHNARCRWFGRTKSGHYGGGNEGRACGLCGG